MAYNVSNRYREIVYNEEKLYTCSLSINNVNVPMEQIKSITIQRPIIDTTNEMFYLGTFISDKLEIEFRNASSLDIKSGYEVVFTPSLNVDGTNESTPFQNFIIDELAEDFNKSNKITCFDYSVKFNDAINVSFQQVMDYDSTTGTYSISLENLLKWLCNTRYRVTLGSYPNVNRNVITGSWDSTASGKQYISWIAELMGGNVKIGRDNTLNIIPLTTTPTTTIDIPSSKSFELGERYHISKVQYFNAINNYVYPSIEPQVVYNTLQIRQGNIFVPKGETPSQNSAIENVYNAVKDFEIYSIKTENYGDLSLDPFDIVEYVNGNNSYKTFYDSEIKFTQSVMSKVDIRILTKQQESTTNVVEPDTKTSIRKVSAEVDNVKGEINLIAEEVDEISAIVSDSSDIGIIYLNEVKGCEPVSINIKPLGTSITYLYPRSNLYPSSTLYSSNRKIKFHNASNNEDYYYELPSDLLYYDSDNYDEFVLNNKDKICRVYKKCGYDSSGNVVVLDTPQILNFDYPFINIETDGNYTITLMGYDSAYMFVELIKNTKYSSQNATKSQIKLTPRSISLDVLNGEKNAGIKIRLLNEDGSELDSTEGNIVMTGLVSFSDLSGEGRTTINGSNITTGSINANLIKTGTIDASVVNVTNINANNITSGNIQSANYVAGTSGTKIDLTNGTIDTKNFKVSANGTITGSLNGNNITITNINASNINSGTLNLSTAQGSVKFGQGTNHLQTTGLNIGIDGVNAGINLGESGISNCSGIGSSQGILFEITQQGYGLGYFIFTSQTASITMKTIYDHIYGGSSINMKEKIKLLTKDEKTNIYDTVKNIPLYRYEYKNGYNDSKKGTYYGFMLEDLENTKISDIIHIEQNNKDKNIKTFDTAELSKLNLILIQELQNKIDILENKIKNMEA